MSEGAPECIIAVKPLGGSWGKLGVDYAPGVSAEGVSWTHELPGGPASFNCTLKRNSRDQWPDLTPFTPIACMLEGQWVWSGRIMQTPTQRGSSSEISVNAQGLWGHLSDDPIDKTWVISDLSKFVDLRVRDGAVLTLAQAKMQVQTGNQIVISFPNNTGDPAYPANAIAGVTIDLGPNNVAKRCVATWLSSNNAAGLSLYCRAHSNPSVQSGGGSSSDAFNFTMASGASGTTAGTFATGYRYVTFFMYWAAGGTIGADVSLTLTGVQLFTDTADESGNASILKASTVISEAFALGCDSDIVNTTDLTGVTSTSFVIPEYYTPGRRTVAEIIDDVNAYHSYQAYLTSDPLSRLMYRAVPTTPTYILSDSDGYDFQNASANDGSEIYNRVRLRYTQGDGTIGEVTSTPTTDTTFVGRRSFTRTKTLEVRSRLSSAAAQQISDTYLASYASAPLRGSVKVTGRITRADGTRPPAGVVQAGDVVLLGGERDPETGAQGRRGQVASVNYDHDGVTTSLTIDSRRDYLDALLARLGGA